MHCTTLHTSTCFRAETSGPVVQGYTLGTYPFMSRLGATNPLLKKTSRLYVLLSSEQSAATSVKLLGLL